MSSKLREESTRTKGPAMAQAMVSWRVGQAHAHFYCVWLEPEEARAKECLACLFLMPIGPVGPQVPDLSFDESCGTEFSLILFSFSKECLTGNHHRSKHSAVPCTKTLWVLWSAWVLEEQGTASHCPFISRDQSIGLSSKQGSNQRPKPALCP